MSLFGYGSTAPKATSSSTPPPRLSSSQHHDSTAETPLLQSSREGYFTSPSQQQHPRPPPGTLPTVTATGDVSHEAAGVSQQHPGEVGRPSREWFSSLWPYRHSPPTASSHMAAAAAAADADEQKKINEMKLAQEHMRAKHHHAAHVHSDGNTPCELPKGIQTFVAPEHHAMVEHMVVKVRDSADVTQKTIFYFWDEWKEFINKGNVVDLGVGIVIGGAFTALIDSLVADIFTPPLSLWVMGSNLENSFFVLRQGRTPGKKYATVEEAQADGAVTENTGHFLKACINFLFVAFCLFWVMKAMHNIRKEKIRPPPKVKTCNWCRESIALDAFRCRYCQSYVKDIPGLEDCGVGMFVKIKKPKQTISSTAAVNGSSNDTVVSSPAGGGHVLEKTNITSSPTHSRSGSLENVADAKQIAATGTATTGPSEGKQIAAEISQESSS